MLFSILVSEMANSPKAIMSSTANALEKTTKTLMKVFVFVGRILSIAR
jgi:hypothetical protein